VALLLASWNRLAHWATHPTGEPFFSVHCILHFPKNERGRLHKSLRSNNFRFCRAGKTVCRNLLWYNNLRLFSESAVHHKQEQFPDRFFRKCSQKVQIM